MSQELHELSGFVVAGVETRASNDDPSPIAALWSTVFDDPGIQALADPGEEMIALYCDYEGDHTQPYTFFLGRRVPLGTEIPEGLVRREVPAGRYAVFLAEGPIPQALIETWGRIWNAPLERRFDVDYEIHRTPTRVEVHVGCEERT